MSLRQQRQLLRDRGPLSRVDGNGRFFLVVFRAGVIFRCDMFSLMKKKTKKNGDSDLKPFNMH